MCIHDDEDPNESIWTTDGDGELFFIVVFLYLILSDLGGWFWTFLFRFAVSQVLRAH
jgi:hypothetical protein